MIAGTVMTRQVVYDKSTHAVEIIVASYPQSLEAGTVTNKPGQYINQTIQQIASAAASVAGVTVKFLGDLTGTELPFDRVSEGLGERLYDFIKRLADMRNLHTTDDENGNLVLARGKAGGASVATLTEGVNIKSARMIMNYAFATDRMVAQTQTFGTDARNGTAASQVALTAVTPNYKGPSRPQVVMLDYTGRSKTFGWASIKR